MCVFFACVFLWRQEGGQALMYLADYTMKRGEIAEAEQYCASLCPIPPVCHHTMRLQLIRKNRPIFRSVLGLFLTE